MIGPEQMYECVCSDFQTDRRTFFRPSVCLSKKKKKKIPDRKTDIFSSVCLSMISQFFLLVWLENILRITERYTFLI